MLSQKERRVLIFDDLWEAFPLYKVGIPGLTKDIGCKLVLTTRSFEVCKKMECIAIKVELLTEEEALNLFMSRVEGHQTVLTPKVKEIATKVAKECAYLPLAIITLAGSIRGVNDTHNELISSTKQIMDKESGVSEQLKFSYNRLKDEKIQHCFLYCALYPKDHIIPKKHLIEYWIAEGLITEMDSMEAMFDKGHTILNELINTCLLDTSQGIGLSFTAIQSLPESISKLENLYALSLANCRQLSYVPSLEKLKALKELKLTESQIEESLVVLIVDKKDQDDKQEKYYPEATEVCIQKYWCKHMTRLNNIEYLNIRRWDYHIRLSNIQSLRDVRDLTRFIIEDCDGLESIFSSSSLLEDYQIPLRTVEELRFIDLPNFRVLFDRVVLLHNISFNLKELDFLACPRIKYIFPAKLSQNFQTLRKCLGVRMWRQHNHNQN
ncbi:putative disease resistance protein At4g10780 [Camellia sinensis]|uniref:putative disease resistance protein At4g10780 n=1 Tax=Camellia sinensis TaxID=4442 RepID=UPI0010358570|nr:putative disease resistance protein At4g10780 [Camellia sinensis]